MGGSLSLARPLCSNQRVAEQVLRQPKVRWEEFPGDCVRGQLTYLNQGRGLYREAFLVITEGRKVKDGVFR